MKKLKISRESKKEDTIINIKGVKLGGKEIIVIAGPCSVADEKEIITIAKAVKEKGAKILRGGTYKMRTNPYSFQGLGEKGVLMLKKAGKEAGMPVVTEITDSDQIKFLSENVDIIQVGTRNMYNYDLLKKLGKIRTPIILKRGFTATIEEWLNAAEYIAAEGNMNIILCERGIRTFDTYTRNTLDLSVIPALKEKTHLPIIIDPSHATGIRSYVIPMSKAAVAAGCDGLLIEVHTNPEKSLSDKDQTISVDELNTLIKEVRKIAEATDKTL